MKEYGPIHILWSASEEDLADTLSGVASCIDSCCKATEKRMSGLSEALLPVVHEYVLYSEILMVRTPNCTFNLVPDLINKLHKFSFLFVFHHSPPILAGCFACRCSMNVCSLHQ